MREQLFCARAERAATREVEAVNNRYKQEQFSMGQERAISES